MRVTHYVLQSGFSTTLTTTLSTPVFRRKPLSLYTFDHPLKPALWHPTLLTGVCPKWCPSRMLGHIWRSETDFPSAAFWLKGTRSSHKGLGQVNVAGRWPAKHRLRLESPELQLLCACALCACALAFHDGAVDQTLVQGRRLHHAWKTSGKQWLTCQSAAAVFLSSSGIVAAWPKFAKKHAIICLEALLFLLNFIGGFSSGKTHTADCCFVSGSYWYTQVSLLLQCPSCEETFLLQIFLACECTSPPFPASALHSAYGAPNRHNVSLHQGSGEDCRWDFRWNLHDILYFSICHFWVLN